MFALRCAMTVGHSVATAFIWYEYFRMVEIGRQYSPEVLLTVHWRSPTLAMPLGTTAVCFFMWASLIARAFKRDREDP